MITFFISLFLLTILLGIGFKLTGALLGAAFWLLIQLPLALIAWGIGLVCCCTIILIPIGIWFFKIGLQLLIPGCFI